MCISRRSMTYLGVLIGIFIGSPGAQAEEFVPSTPYTAIEVIKHFNSEGNEKVRETITHSVREDGSKARRVRRFRMQGSGLITDFTNIRMADSGNLISVYPRIKVVTTILGKGPGSHKKRLSAAELCALQEREADSVEEHPEISSILGYRVIKTVREVQKCATCGKARFERWLAPMLGCFPLRSVTSRMTKDDEVKAFNVHEIVSFIEGAEEALFEVPSEYAERSPSEVAYARALLAGETGCPDCSSDLIRMADDRYFRSRGKQK